MQEFKANLIEKIKRTPSVMSFRFRMQEPVEFISGQFLRVIFDEENKNNSDLNKYLSFSSAPGKKDFEVTKRLSQSDFSQKLIALAKADEVVFAGPLGKCILCSEDKQICFLAGGIGITPIISIIESVADKKLDTDIVLFYSNKYPEEIAFKPELDVWAKQNKNIKIIYTITDCEPRDNQCLRGRITSELVLEKVNDIKLRKIFIFGPPKMVEAMKVLAYDLGCDKEMVVTESFIGY